MIGLSRRPRDVQNARWIAVDLNDPADCQRKLGALHDVTHIFYAARHDHPEGEIESVEINAAMFRNVLTVLEPIAKLQHVHAVHGAKYYGHHVSKLPLPVTEDTPRWNNRNFYFEQEDFLRAQNRGKAWTYSTSRPHSFCDPAIDYARSAGLVIAVYAAVQRELGLALDFPGTATGFQVHTQFTDTRLLARCIAWMAEEPRCATQAFNVVNGDKPRWADLWPGFATYFGMQAGGPCNFKRSITWPTRAVWERSSKNTACVRRSSRPSPCGRTAITCSGRSGTSSRRWTKARALGFSEALDSGLHVLATLRAVSRRENHPLSVCCAV